MGNQQEPTTFSKSLELTFSDVSQDQLLADAMEVLARPRLVIGASLEDIQKIQRVTAFFANLRDEAGGPEFLLGKPRDKDWPKERGAWLKDHPLCAACGRKEFLNVHHIIPLNWGGPELDPKNFITLCEATSHNCHLLWGHLGNWKSYNPDVIKDSAWILDRIKSRPTKKI